MVQIAKVQPVVGLGVIRARVALGDWLVAEVQAPTGQGYADLLRVFAVGRAWPLPHLPAGYRLLGYLDPRDSFHSCFLNFTNESYNQALSRHTF